ncbi:MAG: hypothetical protein D6725_07490 [Planctomycetota bacterium]|nr:MAG: hypothetical protein D6725_07490 [Planctomycetota bacterium]
MIRGGQREKVGRMQLQFACPKCGRQHFVEDAEASPRVSCADCGWYREVAAESVQQDNPRRCLVCGCDDLWRQKDFPQHVGLAFVVVGAVLSTIAWAYVRPLWAIGILMAFALVDLLLFVLMPDVLVCYRCRSRHRPGRIAEHFGQFNLETAERYRQQQRRLEQAARASADR